jgi:hypothetical protein
VGPCHQVPSQQSPERKRIEPIGLDLRVGNQSRLERMGQYHFFHLLDLFQHIVG